MANLLTNGCLVDIMNEIECDKPVVQILGTKRIASTTAEGSSERFRVLISDGKYLQSFAMLATQLNGLYLSGELCDNTIIQIDRYITSMVNKSERGEKRVLIILELTKLKDGKGLSKIGDPVNIQEALKQQENKPPAPVLVGGPARTIVCYSNKPISTTLKPSNTMNPVQMNTSINDQLTHPISALSPYQNKWVIKVRVTNKSSIRTWSNAKGEGKLFSMDLMDESGEIRVTAFKEQCDKFYNEIEIDKVYYISKCQLKPANKQYTTIKNDYEMTFTSDTVVQECMDDAPSIPAMQYEIVPIANIGNMDDNSIVDIIGICREAGELVQFTAKSTNRELKKRELTLVDSSLVTINLTLWGEDAEKFDGATKPVILLKGAQVREFGGGKTLGMRSGSIMKINPDIPEFHKIRGWFDNGGADNATASISARTGGAGGMSTEWVTFHEAKEKNLGNGDKPDYFQCKAYIHNIRSGNSVYKACPTPECNKKVVDQDNGQFRCEKCNSDFPNFKYRLLVNMLIGDWTSNRWVTVFTELAEQMLGKTSQEIGEALENDKQTSESIFGSINFKSYIFKLRTKVEFFGDSPRNKTTVVTATPVNHREYNSYLIKNIQNLTGIQKI